MKLEARQIPKPSAERVFTIEAPLSEGQTLTLRYVPDREMVECEHFQTWLAGQVAENSDTIEELTTRIGNSFYDVALPHYMDLTTRYARKDGLTSKTYFVQHQPKYKLPEILLPIFDR